MSDNLSNKRAAYAAMSAIAEASPGGLRKELEGIYHPDAEWRGSHPMNEMEGIDAIEERVWRPLIEAMPDLERRDVIVIGGRFEESDYVGMVGHLCGTFKKPWLGIAPTGGAMYLRYGEYHRMRDGRIDQSTVLCDVLDFIRQAGIWPLAPMLGSVEMWPAPITADGVVLTEQDPELSAHSIKLVLDMHKSLQDYDDTEGKGRDGLLTMPQVKYWHPKMMWYGPAGIGTSRGLEGFVDVHQLPFRIAFPNRRAIGHYVRFGDGKYAATGGWPSLHARHVGGNFLGLPPTGKDLYGRVMDFYLNEGELIRENWIPLDMVDLMLQMGFDVFARLHERGVGMAE